MPTYDYECDSCGHRFEKFQSIKARPVKKCPACEKRTVRRLIGTGGAIIFKGSGFYVTDSRGRSSATDAAADAAAPASAEATTAGESSAAADKASDGAAIARHRWETRLRLAMEELGPTFIKLGQVLSTRPDLVGPGKIMNSNGPMLAVLCKSNGFELVENIIVEDLLHRLVVLQRRLFEVECPLQGVLPRADLIEVLPRGLLVGEDAGDRESPQI